MYQNNLSRASGPIPVWPTPTRLRERVATDRGAVNAVLDEALVCHAGLVVDGRPHVLPTLHVRVDDTLYLHGSTAARMLAAARPAGVAVCVTVSIVDGLVLARSAFHHSINYRSVIVQADATLVADPERKRQALAALVDRVGTGRTAGSRPPNAKELAATAVLAVPLVGDRCDVALKQRTGPPLDDSDDLALGYWAGVVPVRLVAGEPVTDRAGVAVAVPAQLAPTMPAVGTMPAAPAVPAVGTGSIAQMR